MSNVKTARIDFSAFHGCQNTKTVGNTITPSKIIARCQTAFCHIHRHKAACRDCLLMAHIGHRISIIYRPAPLGKRTVDFSEPTGTNRQKEQFKLDQKTKDIFFIHAV